MTPGITEILRAIDDGDLKSSRELLPLVYDELRKLANQRLAQEQNPGVTLQPTALVHEAYLRLVGPLGDQGVRWDGRGHFFAAAAEAMRRILIDNARRKATVRHGGGHPALAEGDAALASVAAPLPDDELLNLDEAITALAAIDSTQADIVKLRYFAGLTCEQAGASLGISRATADRHWRYARAWLYDRIRKS